MTKWEYLKREIQITDNTMETLNALGEEGWQLEFMGAHERNEEGGVASFEDMEDEDGSAVG